MIINGLDAQLEFGVYLAEGAYKELWKLPVAKPGYEYDWQDEDGIETDPDRVNYFERLQYSVPILITGTTAQAYWHNYNRFMAFVFQTPEIVLDIPERSRRFLLGNRGISSYEDGGHFSAMNWNLVNDYPTQFFEID